MKFTSSLGFNLSGSQNGVTAARNRGGQYLRRRAVPTNPNTTQQQAVRSALTSLVASWQSLTAAERAAWATYAENTPRTDSLGQSIVLTGQQQYVSSNTARIAAALARVDAAPTEFNRGNPATSVADIAVGATTAISVEGGASFAGNALVYLGRPISVARNFYKGPYRLVGAEAYVATDTTVVIPPLGADPYGQPLTAGERRPVRVVMSYDDGRESIAYESVVTVI